jgi:hypothetical protein
MKKHNLIIALLILIIACNQKGVSSNQTTHQKDLTTTQMPANVDEPTYTESEAEEETEVKLGDQTIHVLPDSGRIAAELVPKRWEILGSAEGDINKDKIKDLVLVIANTDSLNIIAKDSTHSKNGFYIDYNHRVLAIYFGTARGNYKKKIQKNNFIPIKDNPDLDDPFSGIEIDKKGRISISTHYWYSAGSWSTTSEEFKFRFYNNEFQLVSYTTDTFYRNGAYEPKMYTYNFINKKLYTVINYQVFENQEGKERRETTKFKWDKPLTLENDSINSETIDEKFAKLNPSEN